MKADIHPKYYKEVKVQCACGATFSVGSTKPSYKLEICSHCHPFYTGKQKLVDTAGRVDRFMERQKIAEIKKAEMRQRTQRKEAHKQETLEEKITRKVQEKEVAREVEKAQQKEVKKSAAKPVASAKGGSAFGGKKATPKPKVAVSKPTKKTVAKKPVATKAAPKAVTKKKKK